MDKIKKYISKNSLFIIFVLLCFLNFIGLRIFTIGDIFNFKPILFELGISIFLGSFVYLIKAEKQFKYLFMQLIVVNLICIINAIYYEWYSSFASFSLLASLGQVKEVDDAVVSKLKIIHFVYLLSLVIFYLCFRYFKKKKQTNKILLNKKNFKYTILTSLIILLVCCLTVSKTAYSRLVKEWNREYIVSRFGIYIYQCNDLINTLKPKINSMFGYDVALKEFNEYIEENGIKPSNNKYTNKFEGYNVIYVHMESFTDFLINLDINGVKIAPNLTKLSEEGLFFANYYPQISVGTSSDTEFTVLTSLLPSSNGTVFNNYYNRDYVTTAKELKDKGYYTFSMHGNKAAMWNRDKVHPKLGYMDFYSSTSFVIDEEVGLGLSDKSFFKQALPILEKIEENNEHYMGTIITLTNHTPFTNNEEVFEQIDLRYYDKKNNKYYDYLEGTKLGDFLRSAHYADEALGEFLDAVKKSDYFDKTLFVFYGDHAPQLTASQYNYYYNFDFTTGLIYEENNINYDEFDYFDNELNKKTPLIVWTKNKKLSKKVNYIMGAIDLMPTIGNMIGVYNPYALGHDIFEIKDNNIVAFPNGNFLNNKLYYKASAETYKIFNSNVELSTSYIDNCKNYVDNLINVSNNIIIYDLIKKDKEKGKS